MCGRKKKNKQNTLHPGGIVLTEMVSHLVSVIKRVKEKIESGAEGRTFILRASLQKVFMNISKCK